MIKRRTYLMSLVTGAVAMAVVAGPAIADELFGMLTKVDVEGKKVCVVAKKADAPIDVTITDETEWVTPKGARKVDLEKLQRILEKVQGEGRKGVMVKVTHENAVASKIEMVAKKAGDTIKKKRERANP